MRMSRDANRRSIVALRKNFPDNAEGFQVITRLLITGERVPGVKDDSFRPPGIRTALLGITFDPY
jgi:hypothetical protein